MDVDVAENITLNETTTEEKIHVHYVSWEERIFLETFSILCLFNCAACIFVVCVILKFKKLKGQVQNIYILHWKILLIFYYLLTPNVFRLLIERVEFDIYDYTYNLLAELQTLMLIGVMVLIAILAIDWLFHVHFIDKSVKFRRHYKFIIGCVYILLLMCMGMVISLVFSMRIYISIIHLMVFFAYIALILVMATINIVHFAKKRNKQITASNFGLVITNCFVLCWFPSFLSLVLAIFRIHRHMVWVSLICSYVGFSNPFINLFVFYHKNKHFRACFLQAFRCSWSGYSEDEESLDGTADVVTYSAQDVQKP